MIAIAITVSAFVSKSATHPVESAISIDVMTMQRQVGVLPVLVIDDLV